MPRIKPEKTPRVPRSNDKTKFKTLLREIHQNGFPDENLTAHVMCRITGLSPRYFAGIFSDKPLQESRFTREGLEALDTHVRTLGTPEQIERYTTLRAELISTSDRSEPLGR